MKILSRIALLLLVLGGPNHADAQPRSKRVATLADGPWQGVEAVRALVMKELVELAGNEITITLPPELQVEGAWSAPSISAKLDALLADPTVDVIITVGAIGSHIAGRRAQLERPVVAAEVVDADIQRFPREGRGSGRRDLTYITDTLDLKRQIEAFRSVAQVQRMGVLVSPAYLEAMPELAIEFDRQARELKLPIHVVGVGADVRAAVDAIPRDVDGVFVTHLTHLDEAAHRVLAAALIERKLPSFSHRGHPDVELGLLATLTPPVDIQRYVRRVALAAHQILIGEPAGSLPVRFERGEQLLINNDTARALDISPTWKVLTEASFVGTDRADYGRQLTLLDAVRDAVAQNVELAATRSGLDAEAYAEQKARSPLLPKLDGALAARVIDADRARASFGQAAQYEGTAKLTLTQLIYSRGAWANRDIQRDLQRSRTAGYAANELDVVHDTAVAWFDVLRARTAVQIQRANLRLSRQNLSTARVRARLGAGRTVDIHRWEAQIANEQQTVIQAETGLEMARMVLAQLMGAPLEEPIAPIPIVLTDPNFITSRPAFVALLSTPRGFARFRDFMAKEALSNAPELKQLDEGIAAAERRAGLARDFWLPTVALQAEVEQDLFKAGDGTDATDSITIDPTVASMFSPDSITVETADSTDWFIGINVAIPLFDGGERYSEIAEADARIVELKSQREAIAQRIEQRVRLAVHQAGMAFPSIELATEAARAAGKSRDVALDAYSRGVINETQLLDIQNTARVSQALAANAFYDFLVQLMGVHRAVGAFYFLRTAEDKADFEARFIEHMRAEAPSATADQPPPPARDMP